MNRFGLLVWLVTPVVIVAALWFLAVDRGRGRPRAEFMVGGAVGMGGEGGAGAGGGGQPAPAGPGPAGAPPVPPVAPPRMVQPESLEGGFILVVEDKAHVANASSPIFMASSHNGWNPGDAAWKLQPSSDMRWKLIVPKPKLDSKIAFKFTRGGWETVEISAEGKDVENRLLPLVDASKIAAGEKPTIELSVEKWADSRPSSPAGVALDRYREVKVAAGGGRLRRVEVVGGGGSAAGTARDLLVWLPPGYDDAANAGRRYPVLYLQDGQNLFDTLPGQPGDWGVDETATRLIAAGKIEPLVIVGVPHAGKARAEEYLPVAALQGSTAHGAEYVAFLLREVMPRVERAFRIRSGPGSTGIGGSSLGGVIALYAGAEHPETFGRVLAESAPLMLGEGGSLRRLLEAHDRWPEKVYLGIGGKEGGGDPADAARNAGYVAAVRDFDAALASKGLGDDRRMLAVAPEAVHNEGAWAARLGPALEFLFPVGR